MWQTAAPQRSSRQPSEERVMGGESAQPSQAAVEWQHETRRGPPLAALPFMLRVAGVALLSTAIVTLTLTANPDTPPKLEPDGAPSRAADGAGVPAPIVWPAPKLGR